MNNGVAVGKVSIRYSEAFKLHVIFEIESAKLTVVNLLIGS
jgi:hypothetical protein